MGWFRKNKAPPPPGVYIGGHFVSLKELCQGVLICGSIGQGKSVASETIIRQLIALRAPILASCVKPDEAERYIRLCAETGTTDRLRLIRPGGEWRINLLDYLVKMPGGGPLQAVQFLARLNEILIRSNGDAREEAFWKTLFQSALLGAINLQLIVEGRASLDAIYKILASSPAKPELAASPEFYLPNAKSYCGRLIGQADKIASSPGCSPDLKRKIERTMDTFVVELATIGEKARGAVLAMNNGLISPFLESPFYELFCTDTTWAPETAEEGQFVDVVDFPVLKFGTTGRVANLAFVMLSQMHCLKREASTVSVPYTIVRDEVAFVVHPEWDASVAVVARSQKCLHISIFQDFDVLLAALGGESKARHEAYAFASNHMLKLMFNNANRETNAYFSAFFGDARETTYSGGLNDSEQGDFFDRLLGAGGSYSWQEGPYEPLIRPGEFGSLRVGEAIVYLGGKPIGPRGEPFTKVDFWRGPR